MFKTYLGSSIPLVSRRNFAGRQPESRPAQINVTWSLAHNGPIAIIRRRLLNRIETCASRSGSCLHYTPRQVPSLPCPVRLGIRSEASIKTWPPQFDTSIEAP